MYTLDASIFLRDAVPTDPDHAVCHALITQLYKDNTMIIVPLLVLVEIAGALSRTFHDPIRSRLEVELLHDLHNISFIPLDETLAQLAAELAADRGLRGSDAVYVAVAQRYGSTLVSLDREQRERARLVIRSLTPVEALDELQSRRS